MERTRASKLLLAVIITFMMLLLFTAPALAADGNIDVEIVIRSFDGSKGMPGLEVTYFNKTMVTSRRGTARFKLKGLADNEMDFLSVYDKQQNYYGGITTNLFIANYSMATITPDANAGVYTLDIGYTADTDAVIIETIVTQAADLQIVNVIYEEGKSKQQPPQEPEHQEPHPEDPPHEKHPEEHHPEDRRMTFLGLDLLTVGLIAVVALLLLIVIILLVNNGRGKKAAGKHSDD